MVGRDTIGADGGGQGWRGNPCLSLFPSLTLVKIKSVPSYPASSSRLSWQEHVQGLLDWCLHVNFILS